MKKIFLTLAVMIVCFTANAQEPDKKKETSTPPPSRGQERAINESGISVKTESKKSTSTSKAAPATPPTSGDKKKEEKSKDATKPE